MPTIDEEIVAHATDFIDRSAKAEKPFFVWFNATRMHVWTHLKKSSDGRTGIGLAADGMVEHDDMVGALLKKIDDLEHRRQHDCDLRHRQRRRGRELAGRRHHAVPRREGHDLGRRLRVPCLVRWPGVIKPGTIINEIMSQEDWMPTFLAAAGEPDIVAKLKQGLRGGRQDLQGPRRRL